MGTGDTSDVTRAQKGRSRGNGHHRAKACLFPEVLARVPVLVVESRGTALPLFVVSPAPITERRAHRPRRNAMRRRPASLRHQVASVFQPGVYSGAGT